MKKTTKILIQIIIATAMFFGFTDLTFAANPPLEVSWGSTPLFVVTDFAPSQSSEATITIKNNDAKTRGAYIEAVSVYDDNDLANQMKFEIFEGSNTEYLKSYESFKTFLDAGPVQLANLTAGEEKIYTLKVTFLSGADDTYQGKNLKFDICVGFSGGEETCTKEVVVSDSESDTSSGNGGGSSGGTRHLMITKEEAPDVDLDENEISGTVVIEWDTNIPSTSQVVYRRSTDNVTLNTDILPGLGYPFSTDEIMNKTLHHQVLITGLNPGVTYYYRVVSRASPPTIGYEKSFAVPTNLINEFAQNESGEAEVVKGEILGVNDQNIQNQSDENPNVAAAFMSGVDSWWWIIIILILAYLIYRKFYN